MSNENHNCNERIMRPCAGVARDHGCHGSAVLGAPVPVCATTGAPSTAYLWHPAHRRKTQKVKPQNMRHDRQTGRRAGGNDPPGAAKRRSGPPQTPSFRLPFLIKADGKVQNNDRNRHACWAQPLAIKGVVGFGGRNKLHCPGQAPRYGFGQPCQRCLGPGRIAATLKGNHNGHIIAQCTQG